MPNIHICSFWLIGDADTDPAAVDAAAIHADANAVIRNTRSYTRRSVPSSLGRSFQLRQLWQELFHH